MTGYRGEPQKGWTVVAYALRSYEDHRTWIPVVNGGSEEVFLHAGPLRRVQRYLDSYMSDPLGPDAPAAVFAWEKLGPDTWALEIPDDT